MIRRLAPAKQRTGVQRERDKGRCEALMGTFLLALAARGYPAPVREYRFAAIATGGTGAGCRRRLQEAGLRDWRFDLAWPDCMMAMEIEGGGWSGGRHTTGAGFENDLIKYHAAWVLGWSVYRCSWEMVRTLQALPAIEVGLSRGDHHD